MSNLLFLPPGWSQNAVVTQITTALGSAAIFLLDPNPYNHWQGQPQTNNLIRLEHNDTSGGRVDGVALVYTNLHDAAMVEWRITGWGPSGSEGSPVMDSGRRSPLLDPLNPPQFMDDCIGFYRHPSVVTVQHIKVEFFDDVFPGTSLRAGALMAGECVQLARNVSMSGLSWGRTNESELIEMEDGTPRLFCKKEHTVAQFVLPAMSAREAQQINNMKRDYGNRTQVLTVLDPGNGWVGQPDDYTIYGMVNFSPLPVTLDSEVLLRWRAAVQIREFY